MTKPAHETIDWSVFDAYERSEVSCHCGTEFLSHAKAAMTLTPPRVVSRQPCPGCGKHDTIRAARSGPEKWSIRG